MILSTRGFGDDTSITESAAPISQLPIIPVDAGTGLIVTGNPTDISVTGTNVGPQTPQNTLSATQLAQYIAQYGSAPQTGQPLPNPCGTFQTLNAATQVCETSTTAIILMVAGFGIFMMATAGGGGRRR